MKIETIAEQVGLTYEHFEAYAYTKFYETDSLLAAAACRAARQTEKERCSEYEMECVGRVLYAFYLDNPIHLQNIKK